MTRLQCSKCCSLEVLYSPEGLRCKKCLCFRSEPAISNVSDNAAEFSQGKTYTIDYTNMVTITEIDTNYNYVSTSKADEYELQIIKWCEDLKCKLIDKYRKGKEEHGDLANGKPLDCAKEISNEVADILIYHCIDVVQKGKE